MPVYRRTEFTCTEEEFAQYADFILHEDEVLYVKRANGLRDAYFGDGVTPLSGLEASINLTEMRTLADRAEAAADTATSVLENAEVKSNKVTAITADSTDEQYPSARAVFENESQLSESIIKVSNATTNIVKSKQLFNKDAPNIINYYLNGDTLAGGTSYTKSLVVPIVPEDNTSVTIHRGVISSRFTVGSCDIENPQKDYKCSYVVVGNEAESLTVKIDNNTKSIVITFYNKNAGDLPEDIPNILNALMVQFGDKFTGYEPFGNELKSKAYTKEESDKRYEPKRDSRQSAKKYGLKWKIGNNEDLGSRCFDSIGLTSKIGIGNTDGFSDFDNIYPWSEIKRCNIKTNVNGATVITFEGEDGFALDGSNGDVFVRIPKFYYRKYTEDLYEYVEISEYGTDLHKAFIENGKVIDEIFISAFEGYFDGTKLRSIAGHIPANNYTPEEMLNYAKANGYNYTLYDMRCVSAVWALMVVEFGCRNINQILGYGASDFFQASKPYNMSVENKENVNSIKTNKITNNVKLEMPIGSNITVCDNIQQNILTQAKLLSIEDTSDGLYSIFTFDGSPINVTTNSYIGSAGLTTNFTETCSSPLKWHTGRADYIQGSNTRNPIRYRWIENIYGNIWHYLPDITFNYLQMYVCENMSDYNMGSITGGYKPVADICIENSDNGNKSDIVGANYWVDEMIDDCFAKGVLFGKSYDKSLKSTNAFGAYYYLFNAPNIIIANGGGFDHLYRCNVLTNRAWINLSTKWYLYGGRLLFKKLE